jgi:poly(3-hydroxybutyrate) depolymerase
MIKAICQLSLIIALASTPAIARAQTGIPFAPQGGAYLTTRTNSNLPNAVSLGALGSNGLLKVTIVSNVATPAVAVAGTDYITPGGTNTFTALNTFGANLRILNGGGDSMTLTPIGATSTSDFTATIALGGFFNVKASTTTMLSVEGTDTVYFPHTIEVANGIKVDGSTSGVATLVAPATAGTTTLTLPTPASGSTDTLVGQSQIVGQVSNTPETLVDANTGYNYTLYIPPGYNTTTGLVVVSFHRTGDNHLIEMGVGHNPNTGTQDPPGEDWGGPTWMQLADIHKFAVICPQLQFSSFNSNLGVMQADLAAMRSILTSLKNQGRISLSLPYVTGHSSGSTLAFVEAIYFPSEVNGCIMRHTTPISASSIAGATTTLAQFNQIVTRNFDLNGNDTGATGQSYDYATSNAAKALSILGINGRWDQPSPGIRYHQSFRYTMLALQAAGYTIDSTTAGIVQRVYSAPTDDDVETADYYPYFLHSKHRGDRELAAAWIVGQKKHFIMPDDEGAFASTAPTATLGATVPGATYMHGVNQTVLDPYNTSVTITDNGAAGGSGNIKLLDFPSGNITILGATTDLTITRGNTNISATASNLVSVGTAQAGSDNATLTDTEADIAPSLTTAMTAGVSTSKGKSHSSQIKNVGGTSSTTSAYLNIAIPDADISASSTVTVTGTIRITWVNNGPVSSTDTNTVDPATANLVFAGPTSGGAAAPSFRSLVAADVPTLNQNTTGSAASLSVSGQSGLLSVTGLASTNRIKTVRDAADTVLELGGSYTPTGTWTNMILATPNLGTPSAINLTNGTALPAASITAGALTSGMTAATQSTGDNSTKLATTAYMDANLPTQAILWPPAHQLSGGAMGQNISGSFEFCGPFNQNTGSNGDWFEQTVLLRPGTYSLIIHGNTHTISPKVDWTINGTSVLAGDDWYGGSYAAAIHTQTGITVTGGKTTLRGTVNGKNASSIGYNYYQTYILLIRTGN